MLKVLKISVILRLSSLCIEAIIMLLKWTRIMHGRTFEHLQGGFIYFVICEGTAVTQGVAPAWL